jgi:hypothetical protein
MTFKEEMLDNFIPAIKEMLREEEKHLVFLLKTKDRIDNNFFHYQKSSVNEYIDTSRTMIKHFKTRLEEYIQFTEKL